jgi:hypothetical protein
MKYFKKNKVTHTYYLYTKAKLTISPFSGVGVPPLPMPVIAIMYNNKPEYAFKYLITLQPKEQHLMIDILNNKIIALLNVHAENLFIKEIAQMRMKEEPFWIE